MHTKEGEDATIQDCLNDLAALRRIHGDTITGVIIIPIYDHLDMNLLEKDMANMSYMDKPPTNAYLCSGGCPILEAIGAIEVAKIRILE